MLCTFPAGHNGNLDGWIDFVILWWHSLGGFGAGMSEGGWALERAEQAHVVYHHYTHHQAPNTTICSSDFFGILIVIFPFPITKAS